MRRPPLKPALVGLSSLLIAAEAHAETDITSARTTAVATSTANDGAADDVVISSAGSVKLDSGVAVTLDSNNSVSNAGTIEIEDADDSVGVKILGGLSGSFINSGTITVDETTTITDDDGDGDYDGLFATGFNRFGVWVTGDQPFTGTITNSGSITIEGQDSAGLLVETNLVGSIANSGAITVTGDRSVGLRTTGTVSGDVAITGAIAAKGADAQAVDLQDDIGGALTIQSSVTATGYRSTSRSSDTSVLEALDSDDLLQGGAAVSVSGNVAGGILLDIPPTDTDSSNDDEDNDGVDDADEGTAAVYSYGAAPAIQIGSASRDITIGDVGDGTEAYGLVIKGSVGAYGVYDGVPAEAVRIGLDGGGSVDMSGGVTVSGSILSNAYAADAIALHLNSGAIVPEIRVDGAISSSITAEDHYTAAGIVIESGATAGSLINAGAITASVAGETGDAIAVWDKSGTLNRVVNVGSITAAVTATDDENDTDDADTDASNEVVTGRAIALDLSANTTGVNLVQYGQLSNDDGTDTDGDGVDDVDEPSIVGNIYLGSGDDLVQILNGTVTGDIAFGAGSNIFEIDGGASVKGAITATGGALALSIGSGGLTVTNTGQLNLTSLNLGSGSTLMLAVDPDNGTYSFLDVAGAATIADGAKLGVQLDSLLNGSATYTLIQAQSLTSGGLDSSLLGDIPYLYNAALITDTTAGTVDLTLSRKSETEIALPAATSAAYEPMITAANLDTEVRDAFLAQTTRSGFTSVYNQMLPDHQGAVTELVSAGDKAVTRAVEDRQGPDGGGFWIEQTAEAVQRDDKADDPGYDAWSLGLVAGAETGRFPIGVVGVTLAGSSGRVENGDHVDGDSMIVNMFEAGGYWRKVNGGWAMNARGGASWVGVTNQRAIAVYDDDDNRILFRNTKGKWSGAALTGRFSTGYEARFGRYYLRPTASVDYLWLREGGYTESGGGDAVDLVVEDRTSHRLDGFVGLTGGARFGEDGWWGPQMEVGWRTITGKNGDTIGRFVSGTDDFTLLADEVTGSGAVIRGAVKGEDIGAAFAVEGGAEMRNDLAIYDLRLAAHFRF
ncbi:autotransporter domain-containing protein [Phenylobacterium sp.]|uniref:autotransporter outer membrane beta-barrel domain-containing protein n=1 Tax=Phenylobacterium sp. TaxID=1871053 RepID=UPI0035B1EDD9